MPEVARSLAARRPWIRQRLRRGCGLRTLQQRRLYEILRGRIASSMQGLEEEWHESIGQCPFETSHDRIHLHFETEMIARHECRDTVLGRRKRLGDMLLQCRSLSVCRLMQTLPCRCRQRTQCRRTNSPLLNDTDDEGPGQRDGLVSVHSAYDAALS